MDRILNICEIADLLNMSNHTVRVYLANFRFSKYMTSKRNLKRTSLAYIINKDFIEDFKEYLCLKGKYKLVARVKNLC